MGIGAFLRSLNVLRECREARLGVWACPPFLFVVLGMVNIVAMLGSYLFAARFVEEPELAALIVIGVTIVIFIIGNFIIHGFTKIAEANRIKTEFISIVSHQLRSPLSIFKWVLEAMHRELQQAAVPEDASYQRILSENTERMIQLVNMLLEVSRIDAGRLVVHKDPVQLDELTSEILRSYDGFAKSSAISIHYAAPAGLDPVCGDREKLKMVIQNLVDNAIRYSPGGGRIQISIAPFRGDRMEWRIQDSGIGIAKADQPHIFEKFYRAAAGARRDTQGSGLGLYIARSIIEALGGEIGFESKEGNGTTFWFRLPIHQ